MFKILSLIFLLELLAISRSSPTQIQTSSDVVDDSIFQAIHDSLLNDRVKDVDLMADEVCYGELRCFNSKTGPLKHNNRLPDSPDEVKTRFILTTSEDPSKSVDISYEDESTLAAFPTGSALAIYIHGFGSNPNGVEPQKIKDEILKRSTLQSVIMVDWSKGATSPNYARAVSNTELVGRQIALLLYKLGKNRGLNPANVHLIGHSLGAQVSGFAGKSTRDLHEFLIGRITGLDAAAPTFEGYPGSYLIKGDAKFVDGIHTAMGSNILAGELGFEAPYGDVDFYPNGGVTQPACGIGSGIGCSHGMCVKYMEASLSASACSEGFKSYKCDSWKDFATGTCNTNVNEESRMGISSADFSGQGILYLATGKKYPFCTEATN